MADQPTSVESILCTAVEINSPDHRAEYLDEACGDDKDLRTQVERLLRAHSRAGNFLAQPVAGDRPTEVLDALTDPEPLPDAINPPPNETLFDFLEPCDVSDRLGNLGPYEVIELIGRGGMGIVFRAQDPKLNRVVAVKVLAPEFAANATARKRFLREARAAAAVSHTHVVTIHAVEDDDKTPYLVMECIDGQTLQDKIKRDGTLQIEEILRIGSQIAAGLAAAHGQGLVHRDVKPSNILLENGVERVKITDFGLARAVDDVGITRTGDVAGTPEFMSPEQAQGRTVEHRSDLFSLGSVLYAMCTGRSPFRADMAVAALRRVCDDVPRPICEVNAEIPEELVAIIDRLLAKNPDERFQTAEEVADLLGRHLAYLQHPINRPPAVPTDVTQNLSAKAEPGVIPPLSRRGPSRRRTWSVVGLVLLALFASFGITEATGVTQFAATVIRIVTGEGTLVVTVDDPAVSVTIEDQDIVITGAGPKEVRLKAGEYRLRANKNGKPVPIDQELVAITRGGREVVNIKLLAPETKAETAEVEPPHQIDEVPWADIVPADAPPPAVAPFDAATAKEHQKAWAEYLSVPIERKIDLSGGEKLTLILIPPGEFLMGSSEEERARFLGQAKAARDSWASENIPTEGSQHRVKITEPFYLGKYEVTQSQWAAVMGNNPSKNKDPVNPVEQVSWEDTQPLLAKLNQGHVREAMKFVLPTEAQWEYACRAGTTTFWHWGDSEDALAEFANSSGIPRAVGQLRPNPWGLHDMVGNVWEWCADWYGTDYYSKSPQNDPRGLPTASYRVNRGGHWYHATFCRSAFRNAGWPHTRDPYLGFRVAAILVDGSNAKVEPPAQRESVPWTDILPADAPAPAVAPFDSAAAKGHQQAWAEYLDVPIDQEVDLGDGVKLPMVLIPPGEFVMGSSEEERARFVEEAQAANEPLGIDRVPAEGPQHRVRITMPFAMSRHEVTRGQFRAFVDQTGCETEAERRSTNPRFFWNADPGFTQTDDHPVVNVSWNDVVAFCQWLSEAEGADYHLPTEAQWEYACRAGTTGRWHCGDSDATLEECAWFIANAGYTTYPVSQLKPNPWGLYDMHGNVWEWCADRYSADYYEQSPPDDPVGSAEDPHRVARGGCWALAARICRSAYRDDNTQSGYNYDLGFRVAAVVADESSRSERTETKRQSPQPEPNTEPAEETQRTTGA